MTLDKERDNSLDAIRRRYDRANEQAIVMHDRVAFDSLQDVFYLIGVVKDLQKQIEELTKK